MPRPTRRRGAIAFGAGRSVVVGPDGLRESSRDGATREHAHRAPGEELNSVAWTGADFLAAGPSSAYRSVDGISWSKEAEGAPCEVLFAEPGPYLDASWGGHLWSLPDGRTWTKCDIPPRRHSRPSPREARDDARHTMPGIALP